MSDSSFRIESNVLEGDILLIRPWGNLDSVSTPEFDRVVREHLESGHTRIIVDCQRLGYVSSIGIGSLVALQSRLRRSGGEVKLVAIQGPVMEVLRIVRLDKILGIYGDAEFARHSFQEQDATT
jgi:anti-sigma B factor antagonist